MSGFSDGGDISDVRRQFGKKGDFHCLSDPYANIVNQFRFLDKKILSISLAIANRSFKLVYLAAG